MTGLRDLELASGESVADVAEVVQDVALEFTPGTVAQLSVTLADPGRALHSHGLLELGTLVRWRGTDWQVGSVDRTFTAWGAGYVVRCRSALAKQLRLTTGPRADKGVTPAEWIGKRVAEAGGKAVVEPGAKARTITMKRGVSVLDTIGALASATEVQWVEAEGILAVGTPWWALQGGSGLPTWAVSWPEDALELTAGRSEDDKADGATAALSLAYADGAELRPWHRIDLAGTGTEVDGIWLVESVRFSDDGVSPVSVGLVRPLQTGVKAGSSPKPKPAADKPKPAADPAPKAPAPAPKGSGAKSPKASPGTPAKPAPRAPAAPPRKTAPAPREPSRSLPESGRTHAPLPGWGMARLSAGWRYSGGSLHAAYDYGVKRGTAVYAVRDAYVAAVVDGHRNVNYDQGSGSPANNVLLWCRWNGQPITVCYRHLSPGIRVRRGQRIGAGTQIGTTGRNGHATGDHLHIHVMRGHVYTVFGNLSGNVIFPPSKVW